MIVAAVRAAMALPAGARIPLHFGSVERCDLVPKRAGVVIWPAAGVVGRGYCGDRREQPGGGLGAGGRHALAPAAAGVLSAFAAGALAMARRAGVPPAVPGAARERETSARSE